MRSTILLTAGLLTFAPCAMGQPAGTPDQDLLNARQALARQYREAIAASNAAAMADHYTADGVYTQLCPESPSAIGREMIQARFAAGLKAGLRDYTATVKTIRLLSENIATSTGTSNFTVTGPDGAPQQIKGYWVDTLRREGGEWRVSFQAFVRVPCGQ